MRYLPRKESFQNGHDLAVGFWSEICTNLCLSHLGKGMRILLVDDDPIYLNLLAEILRLYSHQVRQAVDGNAALEILGEEKIDLIISDASMPNINGLELHKKVRSDERLREIPFAWNSVHKDVLEVLHMADPEVDFKFDKADPISSLLYIINHLDAKLNTRVNAESQATSASQPPA
jgi:CheY-like chemotaxis protein